MHTPQTVDELRADIDRAEQILEQACIDPGFTFSAADIAPIVEYTLCMMVEMEVPENERGAALRDALATLAGRYPTFQPAASQWAKLARVLH